MNDGNTYQAIARSDDIRCTPLMPREKSLLCLVNHLFKVDHHLGDSQKIFKTHITHIHHWWIHLETPSTVIVCWRELRGNIARADEGFIGWEIRGIDKIL